MLQYKVSFKHHLETKPMLILYDGRHHISLTKIQTCNHPQASPELYCYAMGVDCATYFATYHAMCNVFHEGSEEENKQEENGRKKAAASIFFCGVVQLMYLHIILSENISGRTRDMGGCYQRMFVWYISICIE